jgi:hypothetical protein
MSVTSYVVENKMLSRDHRKAAEQAQYAYATTPAPTPPPCPPDDAMVAQLEQLAKLKQAGALTDTEFSTAKAKLLAG